MYFPADNFSPAPSKPLPTILWTGVTGYTSTSSKLIVPLTLTSATFRNRLLGALGIHATIVPLATMAA